HTLEQNLAKLTRKQKRPINLFRGYVITECTSEQCKCTYTAIVYTMLIPLVLYKYSLIQCKQHWIYVNILDTKKLSLNSMPVLRKMGWAKALDMEPPRA